MPGTFDGFRKQALMRRADSTDSPGQNLSPFRDEMTEELSIFKVDVGNFFSAEFADSLAPNAEPSRTWHSSSPFYFWDQAFKTGSTMNTLYTPDGEARSGSLSSGLSDISETSEGVFPPFFCLAALIFSDRLTSSSIRTEIKRMI
jgi:hypothetical protein